MSQEVTRILLVIAGGIAAYKCLDLIRRLKDTGASVRCILTDAGSRFVTPLSVATLAGEGVHTDLFALMDKGDIGHLALAHDRDLIVVAPATADIIAKMAHGIADDLATATLLAANRPILIAPAMNTRMWRHPATQRNLACLEEDGVGQVGPNDGSLAEDESGMGRMAEVPEIVAAVEACLGKDRPLAGLKALVTSGPTFEPIDPVRFIGNRSSGKQGHAIAAACAEAGAIVRLVSGPTHEPDPRGVEVVKVETAIDMLAACEAGLPVDFAVCAAAVSDWRSSQTHDQKLKVGEFADGNIPPLQMTQNPDILRCLSAGPRRPRLVIGFAAETENIVAHASSKLETKGCDWILANDVSRSSGTFGGDTNTVHLFERSSEGVDATKESWPRMSKISVAKRLVERITKTLRDGVDT